MNSLTKLVEGASIPELKEAIRLFQARCPGSNELSQNLSGILQFEEKNSRDGLKGVVEGVCEAFQECREILEGLLGGDEDEEVSKSWVLDGSQEEDDDSELEMARRKSKKNGKRKRDILSSPPKPKIKKVKSTSSNSTQRDEKSKLLLPKIPSWWPDISIVQKKSNISSSSSAPPLSASKRKRTIEEIFEADRQRREAEAREEAERRRHDIEMRAKCAQCKAPFLTDQNWVGSCVFHPGAMRQYHPAYRSYSRKWFCCGKERHKPGCMEAKHIDDRIPGELERIIAIRESAREEANAVVYRNCEECERDVEVESDFEDGIKEPETEEEVMVEEVSDEEVVPDEEEIPDDEKDTVPPEDSVVPDDQHLSPDQNVPPTETNPKVDERGIFDLVTLRRPVENVSSPSPERFLCHACEERAALRPCTCCMRLYPHGTEPGGNGLCPDCKGENGYDEESEFYNEWWPF